MERRYRLADAGIVYSKSCTVSHEKNSEVRERPLRRLISRLPLRINRPSVVDERSKMVRAVRFERTISSIRTTRDSQVTLRPERRWSGRSDSNRHIPGSKPDPLRKLRYAPMVVAEAT